MSNQQYPEPTNLRQTIDETMVTVVERVYLSITTNADPDVRACAEDTGFLESRQLLEPVLEHFLKPIFQQFYQVGFHWGFHAKLASTGALGERVKVLKHDHNGRIEEFIKIPLNLAGLKGVE